MYIYKDSFQKVFFKWITLKSLEFLKFIRLIIYIYIHIYIDYFTEIGRYIYIFQ